MKRKIYILIISVFLSFFSLIYFTNTGYSLLLSLSNKIPQGNYLLSVTDKLINEFDFIRFFKKQNLSEFDIINLKSLPY